MNYSTCSDINDADVAFRPALPVIFKIAKLFEQLDRDGNKIKFELDYKPLKNNRKFRSISRRKEKQSRKQKKAET
jgi:hypothetical protein